MYRTKSGHVFVAVDTHTIFFSNGKPVSDLVFIALTPNNKLPPPSYRPQPAASKLLPSEAQAQPSLYAAASSASYPNASLSNAGAYPANHPVPFVVSPAPTPALPNTFQPPMQPEIRRANPHVPLVYDEHGQHHFNPEPYTPTPTPGSPLAHSPPVVQEYAEATLNTPQHTYDPFQHMNYPPLSVTTPPGGISSSGAATADPSSYGSILAPPTLRLSDNAISDGRSALTDSTGMLPATGLEDAATSFESDQDFMNMLLASDSPEHQATEATGPAATPPEAFLYAPEGSRPGPSPTMQPQRRQ